MLDIMFCMRVLFDSCDLASITCLMPYDRSDPWVDSADFLERRLSKLPHYPYRLYLAERNTKRSLSAKFSSAVTAILIMFAGK